MLPERAMRAAPPVLPSFVMVVVLGVLYVGYGGLGWMQAVFYGVGAAVIGIIASSAYKPPGARRAGQPLATGEQGVMP